MISYRLLSHSKTLETISYKFKFGYHHLTLKEGPMATSDQIIRFPAKISLGGTTNKRATSTFKFGYPCLTLQEGPKVKLNHIRRFLVHEFLLVGFTFQTPRSNNKGDIGTFKFVYPHLTLKKGPNIKSDHIRRFPAP